VALNRPQASDSRLRGRRLLLARVAWLAVAFISVALFAAGIPAEYAELLAQCPAAVCPNGQLPPEGMRALAGLGLSLDFFAAYGVALDVVFASVYVAVAALIFWRKSADRMALFTALALVTFGTATQPPAMEALVAAHSAWGPPVAVLNFVGSASFGLLLYLFPNGHFVPRWTRWVALIWIGWQLPKYWIPDWADLNTWNVGLGIAIWSIALATSVYVQIYRYRHVSTRAQRQQTKWVVFGMVAALTGFLGISLALAFAAPRPSSPVALATLLVGYALIYLSLLLVPLSISIAMLRHRLFDVDVLIKRTLVYGALTASVICIYILIVGALGALFQASGNLVISLVATGLVAALFQPLRLRLQRGVNRLLYGERDDPYAMLARLGRRLETTLAPEAALTTIVETIAQALRLPYAAIALDQDGICIAAASAGAPVADSLDLPLVYQGATIGQLVLGPRASGEPFSASERRLLADLAHQVAIAARAVRLTAELQQLTDDLQRSRETLVVAREEERRRLRRDLHDGLGPTLAALALSASAVAELIPSNPAAATAVARQLEGDIRATVGEIRRLIHGLRPPALDELGLIGAVRDRAGQLARRQPGDPGPGLRVVVEAPVQLPALSAAVEVAAYRIVEEGLANVARHAQARTATVRFALAGGLEIEVADDGAGLPLERRAGVGLLSMRERAAELGGELRIEPRPEGGTRVWARLPLGSAES
jgi:signal transduction histidine kinase